MCEDWGGISCGFEHGDVDAGAHVTMLSIRNQQVHGRLENIGPALADLPRLYQIDVEWNSDVRGYLPTELASHAGLERLEVSGTRVSLSAPQGLQSAPPNLRVLQASRMLSGAGVAIGSWVSGAVALESFVAQYNGMTAFPQLSGLPNLGRIFAGGNAISSIGNELCGLSQLNYVNISDNPISSIDGCFFQTNTALEQLYLHGNIVPLALPTVPSSPALHSLTTVHMFDSRLTALGNALDDAPSVE